MNRKEKVNFWLYAIGRLVSLIGSGIQMIAIPLYILDLTGSGALMGTFTMLSLLPSLIMQPFAGVLGDRWNRKKIMINMDLARGLVIILLAVLAFTGQMTIWILFVSQVIVSLMGSIFASSTGAMMTELVSEDELLRANSVMGGIDSFSMIVGPILGGVIYGFWGIKAVFLINGISFILSAISEVFIKYEGVTGGPTKISLQEFATDIKEGFSFIKERSGLLAIMLFFAMLNFLANPAFSVVMPFIYRESIGFSAQQYGVIQSIFTLGILLGNILIAVFLAKFKSGKLLKVGMAGMISFNLILACFHYPGFVGWMGGATWGLLLVLSGALAMMGMFNSIINTPIMTSMQKLVPNELRSRVFSVIGVVTQCATPIGAVLYGFLLDLVPGHHIYMSIAISLGIVSLIFLLKAPVQVFDPEQAQVEVESGEVVVH